MSKGYEVSGDNWFLAGNAFYGVWKVSDGCRWSQGVTMWENARFGGKSIPTEEQCNDRRSFFSGVWKRDACVETNYVVIVE